MNIAVRPTLQRTEGAANPGSRVMTPTVLVIHPVPLMRRGIVASLAETDWFRSARFVEAASIADQEGKLTTLGMGDVVIACTQDLEALGTALGSRAGCGIGVLLLSSADATAARLFAENRIDAVLPADSSAVELVHTVTLLAAGGRTAPRRPTGSRHGTGIGRLSNRQLEILELMTRGLLNKQIAWELGLTEGTVKSHVSAILEKLGCNRRTQAITTFLPQSGGPGSAAGGRGFA